MKVFWHDCNRGVPAHFAEEMDLEGVLEIWSREVQGVEGNFLGLIDDSGNTIQFYFVANKPDNTQELAQLPIILVDLPVPTRRGSFMGKVPFSEVTNLIEMAFKSGAEQGKYQGLKFSEW